MFCSVKLLLEKLLGNDIRIARFGARILSIDSARSLVCEFLRYMILANATIDMFCRVMETTFYDLSRSYVLLHEKKLFHIGQYVDICTL